MHQVQLQYLHETVVRVVPVVSVLMHQQVLALVVLVQPVVQLVLAVMLMLAVLLRITLTLQTPLLQVLLQVPLLLEHQETVVRVVRAAPAVLLVARPQVVQQVALVQLVPAVHCMLVDLLAEMTVLFSCIHMQRQL
jgi:hypothetical protein